MEEIKLDWTKLTTLSETNILAVGELKQGVFRLSYTNDEGKNFYVFFVGKTLDIKTELLSFLQGKSSNACILNQIKSSSECRFRYAISDDEKVREAAERQLYKFYQPSCNNPLPTIDENILINIT